jgi:hypothetical protein
MNGMLRGGLVLIAMALLMVSISHVMGREWDGFLSAMPAFASGLLIGIALGPPPGRL